MKAPRCLILDVETRPIEAYVWDIWDQNIALNQIKQDWSIIAWAAKWLGEPTKAVVYRDQRKAKDLNDDKQLLQALWKMLDEADVVITQNGKAFDSPKINARFLINGMPPPSPYKQIDTYLIAKKVAKFTSNKLEYLTDKLCTKYKKLEHKRFPGFSLWKECMKGNVKAWDEMRRYNIHDVLATEELYNKLQAWDNSVNFQIYGDVTVRRCNCGSTDFESRGFSYTTTGKFHRFVCKQCGKWTADRRNLLANIEKQSLRKAA